LLDRLESRVLVWFMITTPNLCGTYAVFSFGQIASQQLVAVDVVVGEVRREVGGGGVEGVMEGEEEEVIRRILPGAEVVLVAVVEADLVVDEVCISLYIFHSFFLTKLSGLT
jgi:hypothetical protein